MTEAVKHYITIIKRKENELGVSVVNSNLN